MPGRRGSAKWLGNSTAWINSHMNLFILFYFISRFAPKTISIIFLFIFSLLSSLACLITETCQNKLREEKMEKLHHWKVHFGPHRALCLLPSAPNFVSPLPIQPISFPLILSFLDRWESGIRSITGIVTCDTSRGEGKQRPLSPYRHGVSVPKQSIHVSSLWTGLVHRRVDRHSLWPSLYGRDEMSLTGPGPLDSSSAEPVAVCVIREESLKSRDGGAPRPGLAGDGRPRL